MVVAMHVVSNIFEHSDEDSIDVPILMLFQFKVLHQTQPEITLDR